MPSPRLTTLQHLDPTKRYTTKLKKLSQKAATSRRTPKTLRVHTQHKNQTCKPRIVP